MLLILFTLLAGLLQPLNINEPQVLGIESERAAVNYARPIRDQNFLGVKIEAQAAVVIDLTSGEVLFEKNSQQKLPIASLTKIMTVLVALEKSSLNLAEVVTITKEASQMKYAGSDINLLANEKITVHNLIRGALISSGNDAAVALAEYVGGDINNFVKLMNNRADSLNLKNTRFANPHGLDEENNYSSAFDLAQISRQAYFNNVFKENISLNTFSFQSANSRRTHNLNNTNKLLNNSWLNILGGKTGTTGGAGECLMLIAENESGHKIITVLLNSPDRFTESKILIDWIFKAYSW